MLEKKAYNDAGRARGLLSGSAWYSQQAFRALNQVGAGGADLVAGNLG